jgi:FkbM family methyltransferase
MSIDYKNCIEAASAYLNNKNSILTIDVGCNINPIVEMNNADWIENWNDDFTSFFLEKFPQAKCIAIEPLHWQSFEKRWENDNRVNLLKIALSDKNGTEFMFFPGERHVLSSFYIREDFKNEKLNLKEVDSKTLDSLCDEFNLSTIDYLKIDVEGAEYKVLQGAKNLLEKKNILFIQFEYGLVDADIPSVEIIENYLQQYGYKELLVSGREKLWTFVKI